MYLTTFNVRPLAHGHKYIGYPQNMAAGHETQNEINKIESKSSNLRELWSGLYIFHIKTDRSIKEH